MREPRAAASAVRSRAGWVEPLHQKAALPSLAASVRATRCNLTKGFGDLCDGVCGQYRRTGGSRGGQVAQCHTPAAGGSGKSAGQALRYATTTGTCRR